jgi:Endo-beta-mannanase
MMTQSANIRLQGPFAIDRKDGGFRDRSNRAFVPVGVNYWPASCGVELWRQWPDAEIRRDLDLVRELGLNCVRFFLRWQDFEPDSGVYDERMFERFEQLLAWHRERGLLAHPSLFVGWMSGGIFRPAWHGGRNLFSDSELRARGAAFAAKAAAICARFPETVLAIDQGNELCCLPEALSATPAEVAGWCREISRAIRSGCSDTLIVSGNEQNQVIADTGWRFGAQEGCDFYSMHSYPVSAWHGLAFDGMTDPLGRTLLPFYVKCARAWGPVMVQEFGTLFTRGERECEAYLRAVLPACREAGANGFLWWCLRDIATTVHPYAKNAFEGQLGLVDVQGEVKPGLRYFLEFARELERSSSRAETDARRAYLYWPDEFYHRDNPCNPGNEPRHLSRQMAVAHFALQELGWSSVVVRSEEFSWIDRNGLLVIAGAKLTESEVAAVEDWTHAGGRVLWHGVDALSWGARMERVLGAEPIDFGAPRASGEAFARTWNFRRFPRDIFVRTKLSTAKSCAVDTRGNPLVFTHSLGRGRLAVCLAEVDAEFAQRSDDRDAREAWTAWYRGMLGLFDVSADETTATASRR